MNLTIGSKGFHVSLAALAGVGVALFLFLHFGGQTVALDAWRSSGKQEVQTIHGLLARHDAYVRRASATRKRFDDSLTALMHVVKVQQAGGAELLAQARSTDQLRAAAQVFARSSAVCYDALTLCKQRGDSLAHADSVHTDSLRQALHTADTTIARGVGVTDCHLVHVGPVKLIKCPSRTTAFKIGIVGGGLLVEGVRLVVTGHP